MSSDRGKNSSSRYFNSDNRMPSETKNVKETISSPSKERYDLRSFLKPKTERNSRATSARSGNSRLSWAEMCEAADENNDVDLRVDYNGIDLRDEKGDVDLRVLDDNSVSSPLKNLRVQSPAKSSPEVQKVQRTTRSGRKRERNVEEYIQLSPSLEGVKRRLGWSRVKTLDDEISTPSSSMHSSDTEPDSDKSSKHYETDPVILERRQKQIDYGKNTKGYKLYLQAIPKLTREPQHIFTPKKHIKYSRRSWDSQIKIWRKRLHEWDPRSDEEDQQDDVDLSDMVGMV